MGFWQNCEHIMVEYDLTQEAFGRVLGVTPGAVHRWKEGSIPRAATIARICESFNVTREELFSDGDELAMRADMWSELCFYFVSLDDEGRGALLTVARQMARGSK